MNQETIDLYANDLDDSVGTIATDYNPAFIMIFFTFSIWTCSFASRKSYQAKSKPIKTKALEEGDTRIRVDELHSESMRLSLFTGFLLLSHALMFLCGGITSWQYGIGSKQQRLLPIKPIREADSSSSKVLVGSRLYFRRFHFFPPRVSLLPARFERSQLAKCRGSGQAEIQKLH